MVGLVPLFAAVTLEQPVVERLPGFRKRMDWFLKNRPDLARDITYCEHRGAAGGAVPARRAGPAALSRGRPPLRRRPALARPGALPRVLSRRHGLRLRRQPPDRLDRPDCAALGEVRLPGPRAAALTA